MARPFYALVPPGASGGKSPGATVVKLRLPPVPDPIGMHRHIGVDEMVYVISGRIQLRLEDEILDLAQGDSKFIPRMAFHQITNPTTVLVEVLVLLTPDLIGPRFFAELQQAISASWPPDSRWIAEIMARHHSESLLAEPEEG